LPLIAKFKRYLGAWLNALAGLIMDVIALADTAFATNLALHNLLHNG